MKRILPILILALFLTLIPPGGSSANTSAIQLGSDLLFGQFHQTMEGKKVGLLTNQTGINSNGISTIDMLRRDRTVFLTTLFAPETGLYGRGTDTANTHMYTHPVYGVPVYNLSNSSPEFTADMLEPLDLILVDLQDTGSRHDSSLSILHALMTASKQYGKQVVVLDRPNVLRGQVDGPPAQPDDSVPPGLAGLPITHGMTIGEVALYIQRKTEGTLTVIPMSGYTRSMTYSETGLPWIPPLPAITNETAAKGYIASKLAAGTALTFADDYNWIGGNGIDSYQYADLLNGSLLPGVVFFPENRDAAGGVKLRIIEPRLYNPVKTGIYALAYAAQLTDGHILPANEQQTALFAQAVDSDTVRQMLTQGASPQEIEASYESQLEAFLASRKPYLIYDDSKPYYPTKPIHIIDESEEPPAVPDSAQSDPPTAPNNATPVQPTDDNQQPGKPATPAQNSDAPTTPTTQQPPLQTPPESTSPPAEQNEPPTVPAPPAVSEKVAYLTFDDGPSPVTLQVLDILQAHDVKATFFVVGRNIPGNEAILQRILAEGHTIGGHTFSHDYQVLYRNKDAFFADLEKGNELIEQATGIKPTIFRYPGGSSNTISLTYQDPAHYNKQHTVMAEIKAESDSRGYTFIDWNVTNGDGRSNTYTASDALAQVKQQVKEQKEIVVLMHDAAPKKATAQSLEAVIVFLQEKGYRFAAIEADKPTVATVK